MRIALSHIHPYPQDRESVVILKHAKVFWNVRYICMGR